MLEEFGINLNNLWMAYLVSCAVCLVYAIGLLIANWWSGEDIEGRVLFMALFVSVIPMLNIYATIDSVSQLIVSKLEKFSIKGRKK